MVFVYRLLLAMAVLPGIVFMIYVYKKDTVESEPVSLIIRLLVLGAVATIPAGYLEGWLIALDDSLTATDSTLNLFIKYFVIVAIVEEGLKYLVTRFITWKSPEFNFKFDGIVYAVSASLGFAILENIGYCFSYGFRTALVRAVLSVPGHGMFGIFMGYHYGMAKYALSRGNQFRARLHGILTLIVPVFLHGFYDFNASTQTLFSMILFYVFIVLLYIAAFQRIRKSSRTDTWIDNRTS